MSVDVGWVVAGTVAGALVSSVLGPLITQGRERRDIRADVLRSVGDVERARWAPVEREDFRAAIINLRAAALVASVNREAVDRYARLAQVAQRMSEDSWEVIPDPEFGGGIPGALGELTRGAAKLLTDSVWHPYRKSWSVRRGLAALGSEEQALRRDEEETNIPWHISLF